MPWLHPEATSYTQKGVLLGTYGSEKFSIAKANIGVIAIRKPKKGD